MEKQREDDIKQFMELTNADEERARFFLESSGWNLTVSQNFKSRLICSCLKLLSCEP